MSDYKTDMSVLTSYNKKENDDRELFKTAEDKAGDEFISDLLAVPTVLEKKAKLNLPNLKNLKKLEKK